MWNLIYRPEFYLVGFAALVFAVWQLALGPSLTSMLMARYLRKRRIAWVALVAVMLCTTMVLVVISVMGGWLRMFKESQHQLTGDVIVYRQSLTGFAHYQEMIDEIGRLPEVQASVPVLRTFGLVNIDNQIRSGVEVTAYGNLADVGKVNGFAKSLFLQPDELRKRAETTTDPVEKDLLLKKAAAPFPSFQTWVSPDRLRDELPQAKVDVSKWPGMIVGGGVIGLHKEDDGTIKRADIEYHAWVKLTVLGLGGGGSDLDVNNRSVKQYWIVDDSRTNVWAVDSNTVYVPFEILQKDLNMDQQTATDRAGNEVAIPARTNEIQIGLKPGTDPNAVVGKIDRVVQEIRGRYPELESVQDPIRVETWEQRQGDFINAVEHEKVLLTFLFGIISVVAIFLVFCIFYMIVVEKTRDIGIIKSVGATGPGVAGVFLGYGLAIGVVGASAGLAAGWLIVHYINQIHAWLGRQMGIKIWDAKTYAFDTIPNTMNPHEVTVIVAIAILAGLVGAIIPAIRAARMNPVEALRWE